MDRKIILGVALISLLGISVGCQGGSSAEVKALNAATFEANARLGRGVNLGNALEAPSEGSWGLYLKEEYFKDIAEAGFDSVRVPIRWSKAGMNWPKLPPEPTS